MLKKEATAEVSTPVTKHVVIPPPKFERVKVRIIGTAPLVIHRFSQKTKEQMKQKMETGRAASNKKNREARSTDDLFNEARYTSAAGWDGFNASAVRKAMIEACRLVGYKMTLAKLSIFVEKEGVDAKEPQIPLIRILNAKPTKQEDMARVETGQPYVAVRAAYHDWEADVTIKYDSDQFTREDVINLLMRVGQQVGLCEGRPCSKNSAGMDWGLFDIKSAQGEIRRAA